MIGQVVISGLLAGSLYAMVALGLGLIYGVMRVLNVAHGPLLMLGAYTTFWLFRWLGLNPYVSLLVSMPLLFVVGLAAPALPGPPGRRRARAVLAAADLRRLHRPREPRPARVHLRPALGRVPDRLLRARALRVLEVARDRLRLRPRHHRAAPSCSCRMTRLGKAIRAVSQSREVAQVCGINVQRIHLIAFGIAAALAAAGGSLVAVMVAIQPEMGQVYTFKSFLVIVLGGAGNYPGALLGGPPARPRRAALLALPHHAGQRGGGLRPAGARAAHPAHRAAEGARDVKRWFYPALAAALVLLSLYPIDGHRLRDPRHAPALHVDRAGPVLESHLGAHRLRVVRPRGVLRDGRLYRGHPDRQGGLAVARRLPGRRRDGHAVRARHRLAVPAAQGPVLRHLHARAERGAARGGVVLRGADRRRQRPLAADALRERADLLRDGPGGRRSSRR